jgi:hypothetical protein
MRKKNYDIFVIGKPEENIPVDANRMIILK